MIGTQGEIDYRTFYDTNIESYLLTQVATRFQKSGEMTPFDFCLILYWKSARSLGFHKKRLSKKANGDLACAVKQITEALYRPGQPAEDRLKLLMKDWGFRLPTATAILTVLWPAEFTIYDWRVCDSLGICDNLKERQFSEDLWKEYSRFRRRVIDETPCDLSLRDKDRYLWGKSLYKQISGDC